ncbi:MAG TPA: roadblock/LC7 domain-containing protein [Anaeromyxobacteraceae bacterium]|nr:roadblock/LC7 domain-containing protein [Anaeromyxobacteraceae bacterium]
MELIPSGQAALDQLNAAPGVVGSMLFDREGAVLAAAFPPVFDASGLQRLASQLTSDGYFGDWLGGEKGQLSLDFYDGHVVVRSLAGSWLLVLCTPKVNQQLLAMSMTQVVRRLRFPGATGRTGEHALPPAETPLDRLRKLATTELGAHADKAIEILAAAGPGRAELLGAIGEVEKLIRLFIDKKMAESVGRRMRAIVEG